MKTKKFLSIAMGAMLTLSMATACSQNEPECPPTPSTAGNAYMTLRLVGSENMANSRTQSVNGTPTTETGLPVENTISSANVYLCDPTTQAVQQIYSLTSADLNVSNDGVNTNPIKVVTGIYQVYVVANPGDLAINVGDDIKTKVFANIASNVFTSTYAGTTAPGSFVMFNECNGTDDVAGVPIEITTDNGYTNPAKCTNNQPIKLDRLVSKIRTKYADDAAITGLQKQASFITSVAMDSYKLVNGIMETNLQQKWSEKKASAPTGTNVSQKWKNFLTTSEYTSDFAGKYFNTLEAFRGVTKNATTGAYEAVKDQYESVTNLHASAWQYAFENTHANTTDAQPESKALRGNTTGLVYKFKCTVAGSDEALGANTFYGYAGSYFKSLADINAKYPGYFKSKNNQADDAAALTKVTDELTAATTEDALSAFRIKYNIKVYKGGVMYYVHYIKDNNYVDAAEQRYYSVMRNTIYDLTVKALELVGTDIPGGWEPGTDPENPVDNKDVYMVIDVKVNPWVLSTEDITLK